jgi:ABC-type uncharacterized transport system involved in gliding motility auxiliary subunit
MTNRSTLGGGALIALALLLIGLTVLFDHALRGWRLDLTANHLYTTAPGTDRILKGLKEPINLYFFYSEKAASQAPDLATYAVRVREFLEELVARSGGKVQLHVIDPQPFSEDEDRASELGVHGKPIDATGNQLYFGLAGTNSTDGKQSIEFFDPRKEEFLEYDVVRLIYQLATPKKPVIGLLTSLPMTEGFDQRTGQMRDPWAIYGQMQQQFDLRSIDPASGKIDPDLNVLAVIHPKNLTPAMLFAIDQFALRGGHIAMFVDPLADADTSGADPQNPMAAMQADKSSQPGPLLEAWGVHFDPKQVVADRGHALQVSTRSSETPVLHLGMLGLDSASFTPGDVITAGLSSVNVATAGSLEPVKGSKLKFEPIMRSSTDAALLPTGRFAMLFDPNTLRDGFKPTGKEYVLAARVSGNVKTAFPSGPPAGVTLPPGQTALKESTKPLNLIVVADTDLLTDFLWVHAQNIFGQRVEQVFANNGDLVLNALDNLAGSADLISVRGRASFSRPFTRVENLRRIADDQFRAKEQELEQQLRDTEEKLTALQSRRNDKSAMILTPEQEKELDNFQDEKLRIRKELRAVRAGLDKDIKALGNELKLVNIIVVPAVFAVIALLFALWRRRQHPSTPPASAVSKPQEARP